MGFFGVFDMFDVKEMKEADKVLDKIAAKLKGMNNDASGASKAFQNMKGNAMGFLTAQVFNNPAIAGGGEAGRGSGGRWASGLGRGSQRSGRGVLGSMGMTWKGLMGAADIAAPGLAILAYQQYKDAIDGMIQENSNFLGSYNELLSTLVSRGIRYDVSEVREALTVFVAKGVQTGEVLNELTDKSLLYSKALGISVGEAANFNYEMTRYIPLMTKEGKVNKDASKELDKLATAFSVIAANTSMSIQEVMQLGKELMPVTMRFADMKTQIEGTVQAMAFMGALSDRFIQTEPFVEGFKRMGDMIESDGFKLRGFMAAYTDYSTTQLEDMAMNGEQTSESMMALFQAVKGGMGQGMDGLVKGTAAYEAQLARNLKAVNDQSGLNVDLASARNIFEMKNTEEMSKQIAMMQDQAKNDKKLKQVRDQVMNDWDKIGSSIKRIGGTFLVLIGWTLSKLILPPLMLINNVLEKVMGVVSEIISDNNDGLSAWQVSLKWIGKGVLGIVTGFVSLKALIGLVSRFRIPALARLFLGAGPFSRAMLAVSNMGFGGLLKFAGKAGALILAFEALTKLLKYLGVEGGTADMIGSVAFALVSFSGVFKRIPLGPLKSFFDILTMKGAGSIKKWEFLKTSFPWLEKFIGLGNKMGGFISKIFGKVGLGGLNELLTGTIGKLAGKFLPKLLTKGLLGGLRFIGGPVTLIIGALVDAIFGWENWLPFFKEGNFVKGLWMLLGTIVDGLLLGIPSMIFGDKWYEGIYDSLIAPFEDVLEVVFFPLISTFKVIKGIYDFISGNKSIINDFIKPLKGFVDMIASPFAFVSKFFKMLKGIIQGEDIWKLFAQMIPDWAITIAEKFGWVPEGTGDQIRAFANGEAPAIAPPSTGVTPADAIAMQASQNFATPETALTTAEMERLLQEQNDILREKEVRRRMTDPENFAGEGVW